MLVFTGRYDYTIDEKGRLSIPSRLREQVERDAQPLMLFVTLGPEGQLNAYAEKEFNELMEIFKGLADEESRAALRSITENTEPLPIDKQGRIMLSTRQREAAGIKRDVVLVGVSKRIELWDKAAYARFEADRSAHVQAAVKALKLRSDLY
jgi:MraZ protein